MSINNPLELSIFKREISLHVRIEETPCLQFKDLVIQNELKRDKSEKYYYLSYRDQQ